MFLEIDVKRAILQIRGNQEDIPGCFEYAKARQDVGMIESSPDLPLTQRTLRKVYVKTILTLWRTSNAPVVAPPHL